MRNVWILNHYSQEPGGPGGTRHFSLARHLGANSWKAWLIAASVEHNTGRQRLREDEAHRLEDVDGVSFLWLKTPVYTGNGLSRVRNMLAYTWRVLAGLPGRMLPRPDVVVGSTVHPLAAVAGLLLARRYRVPFVFEVRDLWPETLIDMGRLQRNSPVAKLMRLLERWLYANAAAIVTLLPRAADYIETLGIDRNKVVWIPNGADMADFPPLPAPTGGDGLTLMYLGSLGQANGVESIVQAMSRVKAAGGTGIRLRIIGSGPRKQALEELARSLGVDDCVSFEAPVPKSQIPALAAQADAFVVNLLDLPLYRFGISLNKLFDYMAAGRPVVFAGNPVNNPVRDSGAGRCVPADDADAMARAIMELAALSPAERLTLGEAGRRHVQDNYDYAVLAARFAAMLDQVVHSHAQARS